MVHGPHREERGHALAGHHRQQVILQGSRRQYAEDQHGNGEIAAELAVPAAIVDGAFDLNGPNC